MKLHKADEEVVREACDELMQKLRTLEEATAAKHQVCTGAGGGLGARRRAAVGARAVAEGFLVAM